MRNLEDNWDSYGAARIDPHAIDETLLFISDILHILGDLAPDEVLPTSISPLPSGGIEMEWRVGSALFALDVHPQGNWGYLRRIATGDRVQYAEEENVNPESLIPLLAEVLLRTTP